MASQITSLTIVYSTVHSGADQRKHQSSASLAFVWGIHRPPVNSPQKWPVTQKMFPFDDVVMKTQIIVCPYKHIDHVWRNSQLDHTIQFIFSNYKTVSWDIIPYTETQIHICLRALKVPPLFSVNILLDHHRFGIAQRSSTDIITHNFRLVIQILTSNGSWCMGIKGEMSGTVCVTFTWYMYIYELCIALVCFVVCSLL